MAHDWLEIPTDIYLFVWFFLHIQLLVHIADDSREVINAYNRNGGNGGGNNGGGNGSNYGGGAAYGDPHFMVVSVGQEPLCFDFQPPAGSDMNLLIDPETALSVTATAEARDNNKTFMSKIHFSSPNGAKLEFDEEGVHLSGLLEEASGKHPVTGHVQYGDIVFVEHW